MILVSHSGNPLAGKPLQTKADLQQAVRDLSEPLVPESTTGRECGPTILDVIRDWAARQPTARALEAPGMAPTSYRELLVCLEEIGAALLRLGVGSDDRVALVHPGGPDLAAAVLGISSVAICAPLNPAYQKAEFEFYLTDLGARALVVSSGFESPARAVARERGIPVFEVVPDPTGRAGAVQIHGSPFGPPTEYRAAGSSAHALVLHTSGTTSRPKLVPLTHENLCASAQGFTTALRLEAADRCLNVMPLFHIHGLVSGLLASLAAGGTVICTPGFHATSFFEWMERLRPTWYTAAPTIHQAILARARGQGETPGRHKLRLIRSASAPLPRTVMRELEELFDAPVIECYGMTEASTMITGNPLPPGVRKPGSVGVSIGTDVALLTDGGLVLEAGVEGEVVIRGPSVTSGYTSASANASAFIDGWLRTGDVGRFDEDGYLYLTGRSKEIINRGAEKIAPTEVDEALLAHPEVEQAVAFAMPDPSLGEDVAAAVVLKPGATASERDLREFVSQRLAFFKVPRRIVFVDTIPTGPIGKMQRVGLAERLGLREAPALETVPAPFEAPRTPVEESLARIAAEVMVTDRIGVHDDLFRLGVDSILVTGMAARIRQALGVDLSLITMFEYPTIAGLASTVDALLRDGHGDGQDAPVSRP